MSNIIHTIIPGVNKQANVLLIPYIVYMYVYMYVP